MPKHPLLRRRTDGDIHDMAATFHLNLPGPPRPQHDGSPLSLERAAARRSAALRKAKSNLSKSTRPMPLLPCQQPTGESHVLPEVSDPSTSFKVDVSVPESCLPNPKILFRRRTLPALDIRSEALMLSRQLHLDFHEVKSVLQELRSEEHLPNGGMEYTAFRKCLNRICGVELEEQWVVNAYKECHGEEGPIDSEQLLVWYREHIFSVEACKTRNRFAVTPGVPQVTLDLAKKFHCSCLDLDKMKVKFDDFDLDKSGYIDHFEFEKMMYQLLRCSSESDFPKSRLQRFWSEADKNSDGRIDFEEFLEWYLKYFGTSYENGPMDAFYASFMPGPQRSNSLGDLKIEKPRHHSPEPIRVR